MLNIKINVDGESVVEAEGSGIEILGEISYVIHDIYNSLYHHNKKVARSFRHTFLTAMTDPESPVWQISKMSPDATVITTPLFTKEDEE